MIPDGTSIKAILLAAPDSQIDPAVLDIIRKWDDPETAANVLEALDCAAYCGGASGFAMGQSCYVEKALSYVIEVQGDEAGLFLQFPPEMLAETGWKVGDTLSWKDNQDGTFSLTKLETEWVLVECISTFRTRYMVEVPKGKAEWALDTVVCDEAKDFSQEHLGEQIVSHRIVTKDEALAICDVDNAHYSRWDIALKMKNFFTPWKSNG